MSAAASITPESSAIRAVCRVPVSYFKQLLDFLNYSQIICFGLILDKTVGQEKTTWTELSEAELADAGLQTREWMYGSLDELIKGGWIKDRLNARNRKEYTVAPHIWQEVAVQGNRYWGRCTVCKVEDTFDGAYVAVPHPFFRRLGSCLDHASYVCLAVIIQYSLHWTGAKGIWSESYQLDLADFERDTGLERSSVTKALRNLVNLGLVKRTDVKGKPSRYLALAENFGSQEKREPRHVEQPKKRVSTTPGLTGEKTPKTAKSSGIESVRAPFGYCKNCQSWVCVEPVRPAETTAPAQNYQKQAKTGRAGPPPGGVFKKKQSRGNEGAWEQIEKWSKAGCL